MDELVMLVRGMKVTDGMGAEKIVPSTTERREVYAEIKSIGQTEYYRAMAYDKIPDMKAVIHADEYADEPFLEYGGKTYNIEKNYKNGERLELTCKIR